MKNVHQIVTDLNDRLFEQINLDEHDYFASGFLELVESPIGNYIRYMGNTLWWGEFDSRGWDEENELQPLEEFLIQEIKKIHEMIHETITILGERR